MQTIIIAIIIICVFWQLDYDWIGILDRAGAMFFICINQMMSAYYNSLLTFDMEWPVFLREYGDKSYGIIPYFLTKTFIEIPFMFIFPVFFSTLVYFAIGFEVDFLKFLFFCFALCMIVVCASSYGMVVDVIF